MKNPKAAPRLLRTGIALALACGLMVPTGALAASEDEARENATPPPGGGTLAEPRPMAPRAHRPTAGRRRPTPPEAPPSSPP